VVQSSSSYDIVTLTCGTGYVLMK